MVYTKGPWVAALNSALVRVLPVGSAHPICGVHLPKTGWLPRGVDGAQRRAVAEGNALLIAATPEHHLVALEIDRLSLVIESAVRNADPGNYSAVLTVLQANNAALAKARGEFIPPSSRQ